MVEASPCSIVTKFHLRRRAFTHATFENMVWGRLPAVMTVVALTLAFSGAGMAKKKGKPKPKEDDAEAGSDPAAFLVKPAVEAVQARDFGLAVSLYRGIVAIRGDGDEAVWELVEAWQL